jgi:hypothetical protein
MGGADYEHFITHGRAKEENNDNLLKHSSSLLYYERNSDIENSFAAFKGKH